MTKFTKNLGNLSQPSLFDVGTKSTPIQNQSFSIQLCDLRYGETPQNVSQVVHNLGISAEVAAEFHNINIRPYEDKINGGLPWIRFGNDNLFPQSLLELTKVCLHNSLLEKRRAYILGGGLTWDKTNIQSAELEAFFDAAVANTEALCTIDELMSKTVYDYLLYGTYCYRTAYVKQVNISQNEGETISSVENVAKVSKIYYCDPSTVRLERDPQHYVYYKYAYICQDWYYALTYFPPVKVPLFNGQSAQSDMDLYYYRGRVVGSQVYPLPSYFGAIPDILTLQNLTLQRFSMVASDFGITMKITIPANLSDDEQTKFKADFRRQYLGAKGGEHAIFCFGQSADSKGQIITTNIEYLQPSYPYQTQLETNKELRLSITGAHGVPIVLIGFTSDATIGSDGNLLQNAVALWEANEVNADRRACLTGMKNILKMNGFNRALIESLTFKPNDIKTILNLNPAPAQTF